MASAKEIFSNLVSRLRPQRKAEGASQTDTSNAAMRGAGFSFLASGSNEISALLTTLDSCNNGEKLTPKDWARLTRAMFDRGILIKQAVKIHQDLFGVPFVPEAIDISDSTRKLANQYITGLPIHTELMPHEATAKSMISLVSRVLKDCFIEGMAFVEERFLVLDGEVQDEYTGAMLFNPENWSYQYVPSSGSMALTYIDLQKPMYTDGVYDPSPYFHTFALETDHESPWGIPILRGGLLVFRAFVSLVLCAEYQAKRNANPATVTLLTGADPATFQEEKRKSAFTEMFKQLRKDIEAAIGLMQQGKAGDVVGATMAGDVKNFTLGADLDNWLPHDLMWKLATLAANVLGIPPALLNVSDQSGGLNGDMYEQLFKLLHARTEAHRNELRPGLEGMVKNFLLHNGVAPNEVAAFCLEFKGVSMEDEEKALSRDKIKAEVMAVKLDNIERISLYLPDYLPTYLEDEGLA